MQPAVAGEPPFEDGRSGVGDDEQGEAVYIKANKAVIIASGGHGNNPLFRSMYNTRWREPAFTSSGWALLGPRGQDASGIIAAMKLGATLSGVVQNMSYGATYHFPGTLATRDSYTDMYPGMAKDARDEGFDEIADWFETLAKAERSHANRFQKALDALDA